MGSLTRRTAQVLCAALLFVFAVVASAQTELGSISGTVRDSSGALIKDATVEVVNTDRNATVRTVHTDSAGFYTARALPLGNYEVRFSGTGFELAKVTGVVLHANDALTVNKDLSAGAAETVTVQGDQTSLLSFENATISGLVTSTQVNEMVLNGRNFENLILLQPGVSYGGAQDFLYIGPTNPTGGSNQSNFSVNGGRNTQNNWLLDGADNVDRGSNLTLLVYPSVDAIKEIKTLRGIYSAEYGRSASAQINTITKSGTNAIHGSLYEFIRNDAFNATGYFNNLNHSPINKYRYNDFGGSLGGPVWIPKVYNGKDKTFFFVSLELRKFITYKSGAAIVPTGAERTGDFTNSFYQNGSTWGQGPVYVCTAYNQSNGTCTAAGTQINSSSIANLSKAYLKDIYSIIGEPTSALDLANGVNPHQLFATVPNKYDDTQTILRFDQQFGQKANVFYRYAHDTFPSLVGGGTFIAVPLPGLSETIQKAPGTQHMGHGTYVFSPTLLAEGGYAYSTGAILTDPQGALLASRSTDINPTLAFPNLLGVVPTLSVSGMTSLGGGGIYRDYSINHNAFGTVTKTFNHHTLIMGVTYNHYQKKENNNAGGNQGSFGFKNDDATLQSLAPVGAHIAAPEVQAFANFLIGNVNNGFSQTSTAITTDIQQNVFEAFVQDNWKVTPRLTLNMGVRYSYFGQPTDGGGLMNGFAPSTYSAAKAPTIEKTGLICFNSTGACTGYTPNTNADYFGVNYINGMIFAKKDAPNGQVSPYGGAVGEANNPNFAPRFGFAYDVFGNGKTALRGGYGIAFDETEVSRWEYDVLFNPPAVTTYSQSTAVLDNPYTGSGGSTQAGTNPGRIYSVPEHMQTPYMQQYSLDIQQQLGHNFYFDVAYVGTHGVHLFGIVDLNQLAPGDFVGKVNYTDYSSTCKIPAADSTHPVLQDAGRGAFISTNCDRPLNRIKPYLGYFAIDQLKTGFSQNYNGLQAKIRKQFYGKTYIDANYTWSRDLTNAGGTTSPAQNQFNLAGEWGRGPQDRTHILTLDGVFEVPWYRDQKGLKGRLIGGWQLSATYTAQSGLPLTSAVSLGGYVNYGYTSVYNNNTNGGYTSDTGGIAIAGSTGAGFRPNQIGDPNKSAGDQKIHNRLQWFYKGAFAVPSLDSHQAGNARVGTINGPGFAKADLGIFRNFRIYDRLKFTFRAEAFNVTNHTNWQGVTTSVTSGSYGQVTTEREARQLQFGGKFEF